MPCWCASETCREERGWNRVCGDVLVDDERVIRNDDVRGVCMSCLALRRGPQSARQCPMRLVVALGPSVRP